MQLHCDATAEDFLTEAELTAEESGSNHLRRLVQLFWLRASLLKDDVARAERAAARLNTIPIEDPPWVSSQLFEARKRLVYDLMDFDQQYSISSNALKNSDAGTRMHAIALASLAEAMAHLALRGREDRGAAESALRRALAEERALDLQTTVGGNGTLRTTETLALLLGPTEESTRLLEENLALYAQNRGWGLQLAFATEWILARNLMDLHPDRAAEALALVDRAVQRASDQHQVWEEAHALLARAYVLWKSGRREEARATADTALRKMEELRAKQEDIEVRIRYEDTLAFAYELVAGLTLDPRFGDISAKDVESALSITERMRARALLEDVLGRTRAKRLSQRDETQLWRQILSSQKLLLDPDAPVPVRLAAVRELRTSETKLLTLRSAGVNLPPQSAFPSLQAIQAQLSPRKRSFPFRCGVLTPAPTRPTSTAGRGPPLSRARPCGSCHFPTPTNSSKR